LKQTFQDAPLFRLLCRAVLRSFSLGAVSFVQHFNTGLVKQDLSLSQQSTQKREGEQGRTKRHNSNAKC
jgi:hypothetical protein